MAGHRGIYRETEPGGTPRMRLKFIALFSTIVLLVGGLSYALSRVAVRSINQIDPKETPRAVGAGVAQLQVEGLATERWLSAQATKKSTREPFSAGTGSGKSEAATEVSNKIAEAASSSPELLGIQPSVVLLVNAKGIVLGRNKSTDMRNADLGSVYPSLKTATENGLAGSDVWVSRKRNERYFASFAPVRGDDGTILGAVVFLSDITDERLSATSDKSSGHTLVLAVAGEDGLSIEAKSTGTPEPISQALAKGPASDAIAQALSTGKTLDIPGLPSGYHAYAHVLDGYGDGKRAALVAVVHPADSSVAISLLWPALASVVLGVLLVIIAGVMLDAYISRPLAEIEDELLAILNGQTNRRLDIEHAELGGLVFRINSLLNQLFGVKEDDTDEEGRPSHAPNARDFNEALAVDESIAMSGGESPESRALFSEGDDAYYGRVFAEYIQAKRAVGDPTDHITRAQFVERIRASERELREKHGKPVRFRVEQKGKEVVLVAVPQP
ncbi:MAG: MXAN_5187 C-terminal domain-containing protein [Polyangiaceae bacterium]